MRHRRTDTWTALLVGAALALGSCERKPAPAAPAAPAGQSKQGAATPGSTLANPAPSRPAATAPGDDRGFTVLGLAFTVPEGWKRVPPSNQMRLAELQVPDASGDAAGTCTVAFSTAGGDVQSNISRWASQVQDAEGRPVQAQPVTRQAAGFPMTAVEMSGTFSGMGDGAPRPGWTLRGAIIETPQGLLFLKMTGPSAPMKAAAEGWNTLLDGIKKP